MSKYQKILLVISFFIIGFFLTRRPAASYASNPGLALDGTAFRCLGSGVRKFAFLTVYTITYCLEEADAMRIIGKHKNHKELYRSREFFQELYLTSGAKMVEIQLVRNVSQQELGDAFRKSLKKYLPQKKIEKLIAAIPGDALSGQKIKLSSMNDFLSIDIAGRQKLIRDKEISRELWQTWLGKDSVTPTLKKSIAKKIEAGTLF